MSAHLLSMFVRPRSKEHIVAFQSIVPGVDVGQDGGEQVAQVRSYSPSGASSMSIRRQFHRIGPKTNRHSRKRSVS